MTERLSEFFGALGPGVNRRLSVPEFRQMASEAERLEARAAQADQLETRAQQAEDAQSRAALSVAEAHTYSKDSPHSFFVDIARVRTGLGDKTGAEQRLARHHDELAVIYPAWREARNRQGRLAYEAAFAGDRRGQRLLEEMDRAGLARFRMDKAYESRALNRTDGTGGYFVPPLWLIEEFAQAPRAGRGFADLWHGIPLPTGCSSVSIPKWKTGLGAGPATDGAAPPSDSPADSFSTGLVRTIGGTQVVSMQWAEQNAPPGADEFIFRDLTADIGNSLDVQLLIGSSSLAQLPGIIPAGTAAAAQLVTVANTNNDATQTVTTSSSTGSPVWRTGARLLSLMTRARGLPPTHVVVHPSTFFQVAGTIDTTGRPLVPPSASPPAGGPVMVQLWGLPALLDDNMPITFGGTLAPSLSVSGGGVTAVTDGNGTWAVITAVRAPDLYLLEGEMRIQVAREPVAGALQWRYNAWQYAAALRDRYVAASTLSASAESDSGSVTAGGATTCGVATHYTSNSPLQPAANGF